MIAISVGLLRGEDFRLNFLGMEPITLHTTLTYEGKGERLIAVAKNESGAEIQHAKICVVSVAAQKDCLFELWNTAPWVAGAELNWNATATKKVSSLSHFASIEEFDSGEPPDPVPSRLANTRTSDLSSRPAQTPPQEPEILTNETVIKLAKAGLGDDVIINMISRQPGSYSHGSADIIKLKEAGVSDRVIAAVLNSKAAPSDTALPRQTRIENNSKIFIAPMESNLDEFIAAEIVKQKVPVELVVEERDAEYVLTGFSQKTEVKWYDVISGSIVGGKDRLEASAKLIRVKDKTFIWAGESGDRSLIFGALKRGGQRKLAERIVGKLKQDLF